jgi:hypothetical protein
MKFNGMPERKNFLENESVEVIARKYAEMFSLLRGDLDEIPPQERPTALDFQGLFAASKEEDFLNWIEREIDIKKDVIKQNRKTPESKMQYEVLNRAYKQAKIFLEKTLKYSEKEVGVGPASLSSKEDILGLLNKTLLKAGTNIGLSTEATAACRLVKATIVAYETLKHDAELLKTITEGFEKNLISPITVGSVTDSPLVLLSGEDIFGKNFYAKDNDKLEGVVSSRGKDVEKAMLRYINRPESSAESALKDGIASRIVVEKKDAMKLLPILCKWLKKEMKVHHLKIENKSLFSKEQMEKIKNELLPKVISTQNFELVDGKSEATTMGNFVALSIKGILNEDHVVVSSVSKHARQFEIQIVLPDNKNETGQMNHYVYDISKFVAARTRLDGGCPEYVFNEFVKEAEAKSGIRKEDIIDYLLKSKDGIEAPVVKIKKNDKKWEYIAHSVYSRWDDFGFVGSSKISEIEKAKVLNEK